jgi:hypothetical protein
MPSNSETGHKPNVANFETMISYCTGYGAQYNPANTNIDLPHLSAIKANADSAMAQVNLMLAPEELAVNAREVLFKPLSALSTKVLNAVKASNVSKEYIKDVQTIIRKLQGKRATPKTKDDPNTPEDESLQSHSSSQMSIDQRIENLDKLIDLLASNPIYAPNEVDVQVVTLTTMRNNMIAANTVVIDAQTALSNSRIARNVVLYDKVTGLVKIAGDVKSYVKSVFGANSPQYKQISALKFTYPR